MDKKKREKLEARGWVVTDDPDFLGLTAEDKDWIETRFALTNLLIAKRTAKGWTQAKLAKAIGSSASRVNKMEHGDPSCSTDLIFKALHTLSVNRRQIGRALAGPVSLPPAARASSAPRRRNPARSSNDQEKAKQG